MFATLGDPRSLDPALSANVVSFQVINQMFETLVKVKPGTTDIVPGLARSWTPSADGRSWTFNLQREVKFHDGTPFDARSVCVNFERWYNFRGTLQSQGLTRFWREVFGGFATQDDPSVPATSLYRSCDAPASDEVVLNLTRPSGTLLPGLAVTAFSIASPDALKKYDADKVSGSGELPEFGGSFGTDHPVGTGAFKFERWARNDRITLVRNEDYWGEKARMDRVIFRPMNGASTRRQALEAGEIDGYEPVEPDDLEALRRAGFTVLERPPLNVGLVAFNQARPPLDRLEIRQAVAYALDREGLVRAKYPAAAQVAKSFLPPTLWGYAEDVRSYQHDPDRARRLLAQSGTPNPTVEFWYAPEVLGPAAPDPEGNVLAFKADLEEVGFKVVLRRVPFSSGEYPDAVTRGDVQLHLLDDYAFRADPDSLLRMFEQESPGLGFHDPETSRLFSQAASEIQQDQRAALYQQLNRRLMDLLPGLPYVHVRPATVVSPEINGLTVGPIVADSYAPIARQ